MTSYIYNMVDTWNAGATTFTAVKMNVTDTASNAASLLMDLQIGGVSHFNVKKNGDLRIKGTGVDWAFLGNILSSELQFSANGVASYAGINSSGVKALGFSITSNMAGVADTFFTRRAAANLRLGAADAAAPVAQTLSVQSVVAGTSNTAGTNLTITGSQGTGTGAGGSIIFQVAPAGSTGTAQNALSTALTIDSTRLLTTAGNLQIANNGVYIEGTAVGTVRVPGVGGYFGFTTNTSSTSASTIDVLLYRDAANTLALRNGVNAQAFRVYNTYTSDTNYESGRLQWVGNEWRIGPETVGGSLRSMGLYIGNTRYQIIGSNFNQFDQSVYMNGANIVTDTTTGFKIGTGATQKIGFWNATPIAQPTTAVAAATVAATGTGDVVAASTTFDGYTIPQIVKAIRNAGLLA